ncbi:MAG: iron ABC transporter permease [Dehalococcoidia bacterium]
MLGVLRRPRLSGVDAASLRRPLLGPFAFGLGGVALIGVFSLLWGAADIPPMTVVRILLYHLGLPVEVDWPRSWDAIVWEVRVPRMLLAGLVGATLAYSGTTYQGVFRNPLADPYLIGVAAGAGLGAALVIVSPLPYTLGPLSPVPAAAFLGAMTAVTITYLLARVGPVVPTVTLILAGTAVSSVGTAAVSYLMLIDDNRALSLLSWLLGGFNTASWERVWLLVPYALLGGLVLLPFGRALNVLQLSEDQARQLGVNVEALKVGLLVVASLATAAAVAVSGIIGFVGLVVPHIARLLWGPDYRRLLPMSALVGASFMILADLVARSIAPPHEIPVGIVTAFAGAPFFLYLLRRQRRASLYA